MGNNRTRGDMVENITYDTIDNILPLTFTAENNKFLVTRMANDAYHIQNMNSTGNRIIVNKFSIGAYLEKYKDTIVLEDEIW